MDEGFLYRSDTMYIRRTRHQQFEQVTRMNRNIRHMELSHACHISNQNEILHLLESVFEHQHIERGLLLAFAKESLLLLTKKERHDQENR
jgi:hypothetical protein